MTDDPSPLPELAGIPPLPREEARAIDRVPDAVRDAALHALGRRDRAASVLDLVFDSLLDASKDPGGRQLRFGDRQQPLQVDVEVTAVVDAADLRVRCSAPDAQLVEVEAADASPSVQAGDDHWLVTAVPHGLVALVLTTGDGLRCRTAWVRV